MMAVDGCDPQHLAEVPMTRRTLDILVPIAYLLFVVVAIMIGDQAGVGGVFTIGAVCVAAYFLALRKNIKVDRP
jgi:hypothetical protein